MHHDVIVIGGSYSGMSAALQLLRARRQVLVIDAGRPRNRMARDVHAVLDGDGTGRDELAARAREQLDRYPTLTWCDGSAVAAGGHKDAFYVTTDDGRQFLGRRLLLATGVADRLPDIPGLSDAWGRGVFHCPYCHAFELGDGPLAVIAVGARSLDQVRLLTDWRR